MRQELNLIKKKAALELIKVGYLISSHVQNCGIQVIAKIEVAHINEFYEVQTKYQTL